jgi:transcriptional regulator with XRE-family HTH domain
MRLRTLREARGWTQAQLAERAGLTREYVGRLEGGRQDPRLSVVRRLAKALGVTVNDLLGTTGGASGRRWRRAGKDG